MTTLRIDTPDGDVDNPGQCDDRIREAKAALVEVWAVDHVMVASTANVYDGTDRGKHAQLTFIADNTPVSVDAGEGVAHAVAGATSAVLEMAFTDEDENTVQITEGGKLNTLAANCPASGLDDTSVRARNNQYLRARNAAGNGDVSLIKADASDVVVVADGIQTATDAATAQDKGLVNKKQLDDTISYDAWTALDSEGNAIAYGESYTANGDGFFYVAADSNWGSVFYVDSVAFATFSGAAGPKWSTVPVTAGEVLSFYGLISTMKWKGINGSKLVKD